MYNKFHYLFQHWYVATLQQAVQIICVNRAGTRHQLIIQIKMYVCSFFYTCVSFYLIVY